MSRGFAWIKEYENCTLDLPRRKTMASAGYDLASTTAKTIPPGSTVLLTTGLKAYMEADEVLLLFIRSSKAIKKHLILANGVGVIDSDYFNNPSNEGHILVAVTNLSEQNVEIEAGEEIVQAVFTRYLTTDQDQPQAHRSGGFGSTDQK